MPLAISRRWRALRFRGRLALALLAMAMATVGLGLVDGWWLDPWPAHVVLKTSGDLWPLAFSPDGRTFLSFGKGSIIPWDVGSGRAGEPWPVPTGGSAIRGVYSPDGKTFAALLYTPPEVASIALYDTSKGRIRASVAVPAQTVYHLAFVDDGRTLLGVLGGRARVDAVVSWDVETGRELSSRPLTVTTPALAAVTQDMQTLAMNAPRTTTVQLRDLATGRDLGSLANPASAGLVSWGGVGFSEDGRILAVGREDGTIELWDVAARRILKTIEVHSGDFASSMIRFSPDGKLLASNGHHWGSRRPLGAIRDEIRRGLGANPNDDAEVVVVDVDTGRRLGLASDAIHPMLSPDGRTVATRERDSSIKLRRLPKP